MTENRGWVVQKFGGTSVGKFPDQIAEDIVKVYAETKNVVVVCSARSTAVKTEGTTSRLIEAADRALDKGDFQSLLDAIRSDHIEASRAKITDQAILQELEAQINAECSYAEKFCSAAQIIDEVSPKTLDSIMSIGEKLSCMYMAGLMNDRGVPSEYVDLSNVIVTPSDSLTVTHGDVSLDTAFYQSLASALAERVYACNGKIPIMTGFFGVVPGGLLNQVGRGYTDLCAALIAVGLQAEELQVWKEVDGIFTADPRKVPAARLLPLITPEEAAELTYYGSEVIHPFTMEQVIRAQIPIRIKNVENPQGQGTVIYPDNMARRGESTPPHPPTALESISDTYLQTKRRKEPTAITTKSDIVVLNIHSNKRSLSHGFLANIFDTLNKFKMVVDLISTSEVHVSMALHNSSSSEHLLRQAIGEIRKFGTVDVTKNLAIISLVGKHMKQAVGIAGQMFSSLAAAGVNIEMISQGANEINISCVIENKDSETALRVLHDKLLTFRPSPLDALSL
ncbi:aspartate kinase (L-aspartate 4-P-transferase) [Nadsonia fulvescens var. elongata DSM 6958]|uniref:Aspartokinase n=1 Tax=Nadsonia fulvescens var. elongata DSM 6958 TaxID=857566 RepID=A0A1E3PLX3_9ASCO|nr:aspartate kinase (L-aspartate 4-P-transferase) [Nadsonia fulvescens var. elongata DSM 6958]